MGVGEVGATVVCVCTIVVTGVDKGIADVIAPCDKVGFGVGVGGSFDG